MEIEEFYFVLQVEVGYQVVVFVGIVWVFFFWIDDLVFCFWYCVDYFVYGVDEGFYVFDWYYLVDQFDYWWNFWWLLFEGVGLGIEVDVVGDYLGVLWFGVIEYLVLVVVFVEGDDWIGGVIGEQVDMFEEVDL